MLFISLHGNHICSHKGSACNVNLCISPIHASYELVNVLITRSHAIIRDCNPPTGMNNGIEYYFVEVTCKDGIQYGIQAFGEEAIALHNEAMKMIQAKLGHISTMPADINR